MTQTTTVNLTIGHGDVYQLAWTIPAKPVVNAFVNPNKTSYDYPHPDPAAANAQRVEISVSYGVTEAEAKPDNFLEGRDPPIVEDTTFQGQPARTFKVSFRARQQGFYRFTVKKAGQSKALLVQTMTVTRGVYHSIQAVIDKKNRRRLAVLMAVEHFFPAFNHFPKDPPKPGSEPQGPKYRKDRATGQYKDSGVFDQGKWKPPYWFDGSQTGTSCTSVNPGVMKTWPTRARTKTYPYNNVSPGRWGFDAAKHAGSPPPVAWIECDKDHLPNVGDTYLVSNLWDTKGSTGHVGIVLHVPPGGNGLWVTADGGQGNRNNIPGGQFAVLLPRWGLMGADLPNGPTGYAEMTPLPDGGVFLSGAGRQNMDPDAPQPDRVGNPAKIIKRLKFKGSKKTAQVSNPRPMLGFVDVDNPRLGFDVDKAKLTQAMLDKAATLQATVARVANAFHPPKDPKKPNRPKGSFVPW